MANIGKLIDKAERLLQARRYPEADHVYAEVLRIDPDHGVVLLQRARLAVTQGDLAQAKTMLERILAKDPAHVGACQGLALIFQRAGNLDASFRWYERVRQLRPDDHGAAYNLATVLQLLGRTAEAEAELRRSIVLDRNFAPARNNLGNLLMQQQRYAEAESCYRQALAIDPAVIEAHYNLGLALQKLDRGEEAEQTFQEVLRRRPGDAEVMVSLGTLRQDATSHEEAIEWYRRALAADPRSVDAHFNLGTALRDLGRTEEAIEAYRSALTIGLREGRAGGGSPPPPAVAGAYFGMGAGFRLLDRIEDWIAHYQACPPQLRGDVRYLQYGLEVAMHLGDFSRAERELATLVPQVERIEELGQLPRLLSALQYMDVSQSDLLTFYRRFDALANAHTKGVRLTPAPLPPEGRRIRIGYLSPDFRIHVMGLLMYEVISRHDRERFEIVLYSLNEKEDALTEKFRAACDRYVMLDSVVSVENARRIAADELDLLVDLGGHMAGSRPLILAYKPAPVQITHLGYHGSLGLETVDFKVTDAYADLPENAQYLMESLLLMEGCLMPFLRREPAKPSRQRADLNIPEDSVVFGVFVNSLKLSPRCLATWRAILERVPNAILAFSPHYRWASDATVRCMAGAGIPDDRVVFIPSGQEGDFGRWRYRLVDIVLDTFPYTGGDTTVAALDMGVPVVTLCGTRQSERVTYSILKNLGLEGGIAFSEKEYADIACRLAGDRIARAAMSAEILERLRSSSLADLAAYTGNLEAAYLRALKRPSGSGR